MIGECRLYNITTDLRESHIYPKFVVEYMKKTGGRFIRGLNEPNRRKQDSFKRYFLSDEAEIKFSKKENWFRKKIFIPYLENNQTVFNYDENLYYFAISFLWRILLWELNKEKQTKSAWYFNDMVEAEQKWRVFLKEYQYPLQFDRIYLHFTDRVKDHNFPFGGVDSYFTRVLDGTIVINDRRDFLAVYGKFMRFVFWGIIKGGNEKELECLRINPHKGSFLVPQQFNDPTVISFYFSRIKQIDKLPRASETQQNIISKEIQKNASDFFRSDAGESILNDLRVEKNNKRF